MSADSLEASKIASRKVLVSLLVVPFRCPLTLALGTQRDALCYSLLFLRRVIIAIKPNKIAKKPKV